MSSNVHLEGQTTKKYDLPLSHLDYNYVDKCNNVKELEKILRILRSGEEGKFPELETFTEKRIEKLCPKSRLLRKDGPILRPGDLSSGDWKNIEEDLQTWTSTMNDLDSHKAVKSAKTGSETKNIIEGDQNLPPVRSTNVVLEGKMKKEPVDKKEKKRVMPRDYREWDKVDIDKELEKVDAEEKEQKQSSQKANLNGLSMDIDTTGLSEEEKEVKANREKDKGNEAYRSHDYKESVTYYSRSISLQPNSASYNNRALAYLKLEEWNKAINDCNSVLNIEADNIKALLRRGTAHKSKKDFQKAIVDFEKVLRLEPNNKKAEDLLSEANKEIQKDQKKKEKGGGRRMVIEEVESDEEEEIEVEKPVVNGFGTHKGEEKSDSSEGSAEASDQREDGSGSTTISGHHETVQQTKQPATQNSSSNQSNESQEKLKLSSVGKEPSQDTTAMCSNSSTLVPPSAPSSLGDTGALPAGTETDQSLFSSPSQSSTDLSSPKVSFTLDGQSPESVPSQTVPQLSQEAAPQVSSDPTQFTRPKLVQLPLPPAVLKLKEQGNTLFRSGQYGEAIEQYSQAIVRLQKDKDQQVNLSILLSNRAACHLKTGNCSQAISDCQLSLQSVPHGAKALLRRAAAYESIEKYAEAYIDYKHVLSIDKSTDQAHQGASRCQNVLQQKFGPKLWRQKIPPLVYVQGWEIPEIVDEAGMHKSMSSTVSLADQDTSQKSDPPKSPTVPLSTKEPLESSQTSSQKSTPSTTAPKENKVPAASKQPLKSSQQQSNTQPQKSKEQEFEEVKAKGNQLVQKGQYLEAAKCYSTCIAMCPDQVACYTNRALCYLKLNMANEAECDCEKALSKQADNPKALYRRALARKMLHQYKQSLQDLVELLKLEPKNSAAQKEMDIIKKAYREELDKLKAKKASEQETKVRKRMKIEEVEDDEEDEKPTRGKAADKVKSQGKTRGGKSSQPNYSSKSKTNSADKKSSKAQEASIQGQPVAPPIAPRLMKTTPYEFCQAWNSLKQCQGIQPYAEILRQISPVDLPSVISNKLDGQMLQIIVRCVYEEMVLKGEVDQGYQILDNLCQVPRFSTVSMFINSKEKKEVSGVLDILSKTTSSAYTSADIVRLKKEYSVK